MKRALISVSDKAGIVEFARELVFRGDWEIISTGGTASALREGGVLVVEVSEITGFPEILGGRVKTLHPAVHGGILARRDVPHDLKQLAAHSIQPIDLVVVNLYPFQETVATAGVTREQAIEQIDIGGVALIRAAAKNHAFVTVVASPNWYNAVLDELADHGGVVSAETRRRLAMDAFARTARYDSAIRDYLLRTLNEAQERR